MTIVENLYSKLTNEEDERLCEDIPEEACRDTPRSFVLILTSQLFTKLGDALTSPKTTLAWLTAIVGAPAFVLGLLVPIRESGSLVPQLFIGGIVRRLAVRKWVWVIGSLAQALAVGGLAFTAFALRGAAAGWGMLVAIIVFSIARGFCSVASKDVLGKTVPKRRRGRLTGWSASGAGLLTVGVGVSLALQLGGRLDAAAIATLLAVAAALWVIAAGTYSRVPEHPGATGGGRSAIASLERLRLLVTDPPFRRFVITRALLMCSALSAPYYVGLAQGATDAPGRLGAFLAASGLASLVSAPIWGRFADVSSRRVMMLAALLTAGIGLVTFGTTRVAPELAAAPWFLPGAYFVLAVAHGGVRVGRKTYIVDLASGNKRTDYVAISNTVIGVLLLVVGAVGALVPLIGHAGVIGLLSLLGLGGAGLAATLPEAED